MKKVLTVVMLGFNGVSQATDFSVLEGTWDITITTPDIKNDFTGEIIFPAHTSKSVLDVTEWNENAAIGNWESKQVNITWNSFRGQFKVETIESWSKIYYITVVGNHLNGTYTEFLWPVKGTKRISVEPTCPIAQPYFTLETNILYLPTGCINGEIFEDVSVVLNSDGTWNVL